MMIPVLLMASVLGAQPAPGRPPTPTGKWETLYETKRKDLWLGAVWQKKDGSWRAGGKDLIVLGDPTGVSTTPVDGFVVYAFGEDQSGAVVAVGSRQAVWEERGGTFQRVHERAGAPRTGRAAHKDVLEGVGYVDPEHPSRLVAYGSLHLTVSRDPNQSWQGNENDDIAQRGSLGPIPKPPSGCHAAGWHWLERNEGLLDCHEGRAYLYVGAAPTPIGQLPRACAASMPTVARDGSSLFVACGEKAEIWRYDLEGKAWSAVDGVSDVRALEARDGCLIVATKHTVLRKCLERDRTSRSRTSTSPERDEETRTSKHNGP